MGGKKKPAVTQRSRILQGRGGSQLRRKKEKTSKASIALLIYIATPISFFGWAPSIRKQQRGRKECAKRKNRKKEKKEKGDRKGSRWRGAKLRQHPETRFGLR